MGLLQLVNYTHNNPWRNDGPLYFMGVTFGTLYYVRIYMGPFVTNNPRRLDEELIIEGPINR